MARKKKLLGVITARMGSSRLPGKSLMKIWRSVSMFEMLVNRMRRSKRLSRLVLATTTREEDLALVHEARRLGVEAFQGAENDLVERFNQVMDSIEESYDYVIRITADNPLTDPVLLDEMAGLLDEQDYDYLYVKDMPLGIAGDFFKPSVLRQLRVASLSDQEKEHLNLHLLNHPQLYTLYFYQKPSLAGFSDLSFTIDNAGQLKNMKKLLKNFENPCDIRVDDLVHTGFFI